MAGTAARIVVGGAVDAKRGGREMAQAMW